MMRNILVIGILLNGLSLFGQDFEFDIHDTSLNEYIQKEKNLGSEKIPTTSNHVSFSGDAQPIKYKRKQDLIPDLIVYYFFKEKDSTMSSVLYEWDESRQSKKVNLNDKKSIEFQKALIQNITT